MSEKTLVVSLKKKKKLALFAKKSPAGEAIELSLPRHLSLLLFY
jgi:hypothetical protein